MVTVRRAVALLALAALTAGCGDDVQTRVRAAASWAATAAMLGRTWADRDTPRAYTLRALRRATDELRATRRRLPAAGAGAIASRVSATTRELVAAVRRDDRGTARTLAERLANDALALRTIAEQTPS